MTMLRRNMLRLQQLDDRIVPAISVQSQAGTLYVTGYPNSTLTFTQTAKNSIQVTDGATTFGPYSVPVGINATLQRFNQGVLFNTGDFTYSGNVTLNLGLGSIFGGVREVSIFDDTGVAGGLGKVASNVTIKGGNGSEYISIGRPSFIAGADLPVQVNGSVFVTTQNNSGTDTFELVPGSTVQTNITLTGVDAVRIGAFDPLNPTLAKVGGNIVANTPTPVAGFTVETYATIGGSLTASSTIGSIMPQSLTIHDGSTINGNVTAIFANGNNTFTFGTNEAGQAAPTIGGATKLVSGFGNDQIIADDDLADGDNVTFLNSVTANLGAGDNAMSYDSSASTLGAFSITAANGNNVVISDGSVGGNLSITLGSGDNVVNYGGTCAGTQIVMQTGGGDDLVNINPTASAAASKLFVYLNGGDDTLNLDSNSFFTAYVDGGAGFLDDYSSAVVFPPMTLTVVNFELTSLWFPSQLNAEQF